jgi:hypothetical protein
LAVDNQQPTTNVLSAVRDRRYNQLFRMV